MFEKFESPAFFLSKDAVLAAFAAGRATGLVVDIGSGLSRVSPVHDGYILKKGITKNTLAGEAISQWMHRCVTVSSMLYASCWISSAGLSSARAAEEY